MTSFPSRNNDGSLGSVMRLLVRLDTDDRDGLRQIFVPDQRPALDLLLDQYFGTDRSGHETSRTALEVAGGENRFRQRVSRLLSEVQARNGYVPSLSPDEQQQIDLFLNPPAPTLSYRPSRQPRTTFRWPQLRARTVAVAAAVVVALGAAAFGGWVLYGPGQTPPQVVNQNPPAVVDQQPANTDLQNMEAVWGPWQTISPTDQNPATSSPALLLLKQNGGELASTKWTVPFQASSGYWHAQVTAPIDALSVKGDAVKLVSSTNETFWVAIGQPFVFEQTPGQVYVVDQTGNVWQIDLATASGIRLSVNK